MKQKKVAKSIDHQVALIDENVLKSRIYTVRGLKVMLDSDLAEIYGYSTKAFNQQVKNNIEKFDDDFRFQLNREEYRKILGSKILTLEQGKYSKSLPYAFTEQGIYMLMTVLRGDLAIRQSKALIRLFKQMKDFLIENQPMLGYDRAKLSEIAIQTERNSNDIAEIRQDLQKVMDIFVDPTMHKHFLIMNGQKLEADVAYTQIYAMAKKSILIIDDYVGVKTLDLLRGIAKGIDVKIFSDERGAEQITENFLADFNSVRPDVQIIISRTRGKFHDRYIFLNYDKSNEKLFHCGPSSKDAGSKIATIMQIECPQIYHKILEMLME